MIPSVLLPDCAYFTCTNCMLSKVSRENLSAARCSPTCAIRLSHTRWICIRMVAKWQYSAQKQQKKISHSLSTPSTQGFIIIIQKEVYDNFRPFDYTTSISPCCAGCDAGFYDIARRRQGQSRPLSTTHRSSDMSKTPSGMLCVLKGVAYC